MWHVTYDMWHVTCDGGWTFSQNLISLAITVWEWRRFEDLDEEDILQSELVDESPRYL